MEGLHKIKEMSRKELEQYGRKGELSAGSLDAIHKLTDIIKNIDKIEMLEEYGESDESYEGGGSYRRRGTHYVRGHYSRNGGSYNDGSYGGESYDRGPSERRYSRDGGREKMMHELREMMEEAETEKEREAIRKCIDQLDRD